MAFVAQGCEWLHLVDLNGAFEGEPVNAAPVEAILEQTNVPAQLGGGIRDMATIERWLVRALRGSFWARLPWKTLILCAQQQKPFPDILQWA